MCRLGNCCCSVAQSCPTICNPMDCSVLDFPVLYHLLELAQTHVHWVDPTISSSVVPFSYCLQSFPASGSFLMSQLFVSGGHSIAASASASVLPMNIQDWFPLRLTGLISLVIFSPKSLEAWIPQGLWSDPEQSRQQPFQKGSMKSTLPGCLKSTQVQQWDPSLLRLPRTGSQPQSAGSGWRKSALVFFPSL